MEHRVRRAGLTAILVLALAAGSAAAIAVAGEPEGAEGQTDMQKMMEAMKEQAAPNEHHAHLAKMVGDWTYTAKFWAPGATEPTEMGGTMDAKTLLGGRFVQVNWHGEFMGMPFEGFSIDGYDKNLEMHTSTWRDNFGTMAIDYKGTCDPASKTITMHGEYLDPMSGDKVKERGVMTWIDDNTIKMESYRVAPDGSETKMMEIVSKRKV